MIIEFKDLPEAIENYKNKKKVLAGGCFDLLHWGHIQFLKKAKEKGEILLVALESDEFILKRKKRKPVHNFSQRAQILDSLKMVDVVIKLPFLSTFEEYLDLVKKVKPQIIAITKGDPQKHNKLKQAKIVKAELVEVIDKIEPFSTSYILENAGIFRNRNS